MKNSSPTYERDRARRQSNASSGTVMPKTIRFHLDENVDPRIAAGMRLFGMGVTTTPEAGLLFASDEEQLDYIARERRAIFTQDTDFLRLHTAGQSHPGVAIYPAGTRSFDEVIRG